MRVGVLAERASGEKRVSLTPQAAEKLIKAGHSVWVETGAGLGAGIVDNAFVAAGATVTSRSELLDAATYLVAIRGPAASEDARQLLTELDSRHTLAALHDPIWRADLMPALAETGATTLALEMVPRTTLAQTMDVLSSQATVSGYEAVLAAAGRSPRMFPLLMTAAGTVQAARLLVLGAGVAGLQAISTARRLGAIVSGFDIRPAASEQIESLGAKAISLELDTSRSEDSAGYATTQTADTAQRQMELLAPHVEIADILITTAAIPGRRSPLLVSTQMVEAMKPGSVVVDLAAERGGNVELTQADSEVIHNEVLILGPTDLASRAPATASQMFATNQINLLAHLTGESNELALDLSDEITAGVLITRNGEIVHPRVLGEHKA